MFTRRSINFFIGLIILMLIGGGGLIYWSGKQYDELVLAGDIALKEGNRKREALDLYNQAKEMKRTPELQERIDQLEADVFEMEQLFLSNLEYVDGGTYIMGNDFNDMEKPTHEVRVSGFFMGKYEVTISEFAHFVEKTGYKSEAERVGGSEVVSGDKWVFTEGVSWQHDEFGNTRAEMDWSRYPVIHVSWYDASAYCKWVSEQTGYTFRLPREAEWEYAALGGIYATPHTYAGGETPQQLGWYQGNSDRKVHPIGQLQSNEVNLFDMSGNVWEWCHDWYNLYPAYKQINPDGSSTGTGRVIRGGCWIRGERAMEVTARGNYAPKRTFGHIGFRVVRER
ncbi:MAG: formylglycine-generating enzyme family protein [Bacteroidota bacterium]